MVIVDKSGVHRLEVRCCDCPNAMSPDIHMFRHGFFPASFNRPKTVFTFRVLDYFLLDNLECGTSVLNYYSKLWQLKTMKWHGFGHRSDNLNAGDLALFCPASMIRTPSWKYTQSFVMDRNFEAEHLHPIKPFDEVWLSDGLGFMVGKDRGQAQDRENCNQLRKNKGRDCFLHRFLEMVPELTIIPGIGLWHVHRHQDSCYVRYVSNFIEGIGRINGEIMETLWACLNLISPAAWGMS
ncbi:hypothetical protein EDB19DRAFT_1896380 [Suillus lakei]|nr:hypothetical protein EDB19DRAFT_1896380 [Suillus lakei]